MDAQQRDEGQGGLRQPEGGGRRRSHDIISSTTFTHDVSRRLSSPELVVRVSHLVRPQFGHQDFDNMDENQEVDLWAHVPESVRVFMGLGLISTDLSHIFNQRINAVVVALDK